MPTAANITLIAHLYSDPKAGETNGKTWVRFSCWTSDSVKPQGGGDAEKKFTSWGGILSGLQAEWLLKDGHKGSLVMVTGTVRATTYEKDGVTHAKMEFTRVHELRLLERREEQAPQQQEVPAPRKPAAAPVKSSSVDDEPPF